MASKVLVGEVLMDSFAVVCLVVYFVILLSSFSFLFILIHIHIPFPIPIILPIPVG